MNIPDVYQDDRFDPSVSLKKRALIVMSGLLGNFILSVENGQFVLLRVQQQQKTTTMRQKRGLRCDQY